MKKLILIALMILVLSTLGYAEVYNWGNTDIDPLLRRAFNATAGHDHDATNSKAITTLGAAAEASNSLFISGQDLKGEVCLRRQ